MWRNGKRGRKCAALRECEVESGCVMWRPWWVVVYKRSISNTARKCSRQPIFANPQLAVVAFADIYLNLLLRLAMLQHLCCNKCACNNTAARQVGDVSQLFAIIWVGKWEKKMLQNKQNINKSNKGNNKKAAWDACNIMKRSVNKVSALVPALIGCHKHTYVDYGVLYTYIHLVYVCCGTVLRIRPEVLQYDDVVEYFALS